MAIATKQQILAHRGPEPLRETVQIPGTSLEVIIHGIVRSFTRSSVYREIDNMTGLKSIILDNERAAVVEDDIIAACWAEACVVAPKLTALEWLSVGAKDSDLLTFVGTRCLVCSRLMPDGEAIPDGLEAAERELKESNDPLVSMPSDSVSTNSEGCPAN